MPSSSGQRWQIEAGLYRNSLNAMLSHKKLDVTDTMMREKTMGQAAMFGPEWEPAGVISRKIAEVLTAEKNGGGIDRLLHVRSVPTLASAGSSVVAPPNTLDSRQFTEAGTQLNGYDGSSKAAIDKQQPPRGPAAIGLPTSLTFDDRPVHQIDWQMMTRVPHRCGVPMPISLVDYRNAAAARGSDPAAAQGGEVMRRYAGPANAERKIIDAEALPKRLAIGTSSSPTLAWYPGVNQRSKLGDNRNRGQA